MAEAGIKKTDNDLIYIGKSILFDIATFLKQLEVLAKASYENSEKIVQMVEEMVPTFHPVGSTPSCNTDAVKAFLQRQAMEEVAVTKVVSE